MIIITIATTTTLPITIKAIAHPSSEVLSSSPSPPGGVVSEGSPSPSLSPSSSLWSSLSPSPSLSPSSSFSSFFSSSFSSSF